MPARLNPIDKEVPLNRRTIDKIPNELENQKPAITPQTPSVKLLSFLAKAVIIGQTGKSTKEVKLNFLVFNANYTLAKNSVTNTLAKIDFKTLLECEPGKTRIKSLTLNKLQIDGIIKPNNS